MRSALNCGLPQMLSRGGEEFTQFQKIQRAVNLMRFFGSSLNSSKFHILLIVTLCSRASDCSPMKGGQVAPQRGNTFS
jgi:hypothetical protein